MKLRNFKIKKYTLMKLYLLKCQAYKTNIKFPIKKALNHLEQCLRQALTLIYSYHSNNKKILFIGFPYLKSKTVLLKSSNHLFLPKKLWMNGSFSNNVLSIKESKSSTEKKVFSTKKFDLVVFFNATFKDIGVLKELSSLNSPLIVFGGQIFSEFIGNIVFVPLACKTKNAKKLSSFLIYSVLKKPKIK